MFWENLKKAVFPEMFGFQVGKYTSLENSGCTSPLVCAETFRSSQCKILGMEHIYLYHSDDPKQTYHFD